ncbi:MAG TPA: hypothetical protein VFV78_09105 [Vicinamibacterales bacterium]|nr:hypothetical protein [Vicinamibacterales bacterium]
MSRVCVAVAVPLLVCATSCANDPAKDAPVTAENKPQLVQTPSTIGSPEGSVVEEFNRRVDQYVKLREQLDGTLDKLSNQATPEQIDTHQRALLALIAKARVDVKQGDIFVPGMQTFAQGLVRRVLKGPDGPKLKESLMDENPMGIKLAVNDRYPDKVPLATMPADVLAALPRLPDNLEYRFVGNRLILLDTRAHLIVDFVPDTFDL